MSVFTSCHPRWHNGVPSDAPQSLDEAYRRIDELYHSGKPFFTKEAIRAAYEQFQTAKNHGDKIFVKDITGETIEYTLKTGDIQHWGPYVRSKRVKSKENTSEGDVKPRPSPNSDEIEDAVDEESEEELDLLVQQPVLEYDTRRQIKIMLRMINEHSIYNPERTFPFCSLRVLQNTEKVILGTKELFKDPNLPSRDALNSFFEEQIQAWRKSEMCKEVIRILDSSVAGLSIKKVVTVSLGSITGDKRSSHRSAFQHALALTLRDWLHTHQKSDCCYAQDPAYTDVDKNVLEERGIEVIDDPRAWLEVDRQSILFSCSSNVPVKEIVADITRPAVIVWERVETEVSDPDKEENVTDPSTPRVRKMLEGYELFEFGADDHFCSTVIYVRRCRD